MALILPLHSLIQRTCQFHPWYSTLLCPQGIAPDLYESTILSELPLMTSERLEQHYYAEAARSEPELSIYKTSGTSSGIRKSIYYSPEDDEHYIAAKKASFQAWLDAKTTGQQAAPPIRKALADMGTGHAASTAMSIFASLGYEADSLSFALPIEEHIRKLSSFKPDLFYTMPSILDAIASAADDPKQFGIRKIILVGEMAPLDWQANIAARFGIEPTNILDTYGSIEIGAIASYSHTYGRYLFAEGIYAEALPAEQIDPRFEPLPASESVLVLTSSNRTLFPALRYVTYDVVRDFETILVDGQERQSFRCIVKRIGSELKHGEKISLYDIESVVNRFVPDAELRVSLRNNRLSVHIRSKMLDEERLAEIRHAIEHTIGEIGQMIENRMLEGITVTRAADNEQLERGAVKSKKIYF